MIRPRAAQIDRVAPVVESDEAFNPVALGALGPDAFVRRILSWTGKKSTGIGSGIAMFCRVLLGPIVLVAGVDSGTVYISRTY